jgi:beta-glucosidase
LSSVAGDYAGMVEAAVEAAIQKLDLESRIRLLTGVNFWATAALPEIGLRAMVVSDGPAGVKGGSTAHDETTTSLPSPTSLAATWDEDLVREVGILLAGESRAKGVDVLLGPTINLHRSPVGGRHFEQFSEDPLLTGRIASAYVEGLQSRGVGGCPKHYVCNDSETERQNMRVDVDERPLREVYMPPFERTVGEAGAWMVMAAYSGVREFRMTESPLLRDPLEDRWGFDGVVVSDWYAVHSTVESARAATDLLMPGPGGQWGDALLAAVRGGEVPESAIDDKVRRLLRLAARVGALDGVPAATSPATRPPQEDVSALVRRASAAGSVLLANDGILPLDPSRVRRLAVLGPMAAVAPGQGGGSSNLRPDYVITPLEGIRAAFPEAEILWNSAERIRPGFQILTPSEVALPAAAGENAGRPGVLLRVCESTGGPVADEPGREIVRAEHRDGRLYWQGDALIGGRPVFELSAAVTSDVGGRHRIGLGSRGRVAVYVNGRLAAQGGEPVDTDDIDAIWHEPPFVAAEVDLEPGKPVDVLIRWQKFYDHPAYIGYFSMAKPAPTLEEICAEDERLADGADAVIVVVGTTFTDESEGADRRSLALDPAQDEIVRRVAAANPRTVAVLAAGSPVLMPWRDEVAALLLTWFPGQEAGNALADILTGRVEPGGRMPTTWPSETEDVPILDTRPVGGILRYEEGLDIGYRAWLVNQVEPAFPFGHGLGYTSWSYLDAAPATALAAPATALAAPATALAAPTKTHAAPAAVAGPADESGAIAPAAIRVRVRNRGPRRGGEVIQLYLGRTDTEIERPLLWLAGWARVEAEPGEAVDVDVPIDRWAVRHWDEASGSWAIEPGRFDVRIGRSVGDLRLATTLEVELA